MKYFQIVLTAVARGLACASNPDFIKEFGIVPAVDRADAERKLGFKHGGPAPACLHWRCKGYDNPCIFLEELPLIESVEQLRSLCGPPKKRRA